MNKIILPTAYFGNIEYYSLIKQADNVLIEAHEHYIKQTYRNRCEIATANGPLALTVPVKFSNTKKTTIKDVRIDYDTNWQKIHFKAIESAYRKSPFYEHF
ncbi:MAG: WbqC family protein, partial [Bacteroidota bacterium]